MATVITPKEGEQVLFTIRKSPVKLIKPIVKALIVLSVSIIVLFTFNNSLVTTTALFFLILSLSYAFYHLLLWFYDLNIITNQRVIFVNQKGIFSKEFAEVDLSKILDVTYAIRGVFATVFRFGTVTVKTEHSVLELQDLTYPDEIQEMIKKLSERSEEKNKKPEMTARELIDLIIRNHKK